ncbi:multidrug effflux MFS transporter [Streptomyces iconiensis]|uniref:Multidrug effflux MFS transporter n=1 Tax=Streptomyces iconiensis TaxID=1384038 RepID=A0ABT6ZXV3_9ACTN|nr:multidrug effflux MFS transporter [Streptomyces iconiensis]MDJ1133466.1 multidrug effflux MFS transporter [Streptomyces iconiensis]
MASHGLLLAVLAGLGAASPLATDMYVPGLPDMARSLGTTSAGTQLSLTAFLLGVIVGQLVLGPMSDMVGRRPVLLAGTSAFALFGLGCALAPTIEAMTALRFGQGLAGAAGIVVGRAVLVDLFHGAELSRVYAVLSGIGALGPVLAPVLGGGLLAVAPWRFVFVALALAGAVLTVGIARGVPESLARERRTGGGVAGALRATGRVAARPGVLVPVLTMGCTGAATFAYIAGATFVLHDLLHLSPAMSSVVYGVNALGNLGGSLLYGRLARRRRPETLMVAGAATGLAGQLVLLALVSTAGSGLWTTWGCLLVSVASFGFLFPSLTTVGQSRGRDAPGATSALLGAAQFAFGAAASPLVGLFGTRSAAPMALVMGAFLALATVGAAICRRQSGTQPAVGQ